MTIHTIRRGFDIRIAGRPDPVISELPDPVLVGVQPREIAGLRPKVLVAEGQRVRTGEPVLLDKGRPGVQLVAPATGKVTKIELGPRRFPERIEITPAERDEHFELPRIDPDKVHGAARSDLIAALQSAGLWPLVRQRPVGKVANPAVVPSAVYVNGMDTEPLAADPALAVRGLGPELQLGIDALRRLTDGPVYFTRRAGVAPPPEFDKLRGVEVHEFQGPHPAGLVGTHIARIRPLAAGQVAWYCKAQEAAAIGEWLATGHYPTRAVVAVSGTGAPNRGYFRVRRGAALLTLTGGRPLVGDYRIINGSVLSGTAVEPTEFLGYYAQTVTIIPAGTGQRELLGWATPQLSRYSPSRAVFGWLRPKPEYELDARLNGGPRHIVNIGSWESMMALDIYPTYLVRAIQAGDLEEAINLGLLEVTEEDVALCTYADPCKTEVGQIIRKGLDLYEKEG
jgi:Na+-transporting NADH:ubiquinone oxidoreductase subunit A